MWNRATRYSAAWALAALCLWASGLSLLEPVEARALEAGISREQQIKAAFLYNFTKFVDWPARAFPDASAPIVIGVLGDSPSASLMIAALEPIVKGRVVNGRGVIVRRIDGARDASGAHLLFVPAPDEPLFQQIRPQIEASPVLTVGESSSFAALGGAINFAVEADKLQFEINTAPSDRAGVRISAQLLKLARHVRTQPATPAAESGGSRSDPDALRTDPPQAHPP
jgi:YfiR/HmsC-like